MVVRLQVDSSTHKRSQKSRSATDRSSLYHQPSSEPQTLTNRVCKDTSPRLNPQQRLNPDKAFSLHRSFVHRRSPLTGRTSFLPFNLISEDVAYGRV
ncbi:hypothetical protein L596_028505 [Steinernema carpocapsae]|uniref:Uncharacterized protein n=1 Tax=Steinernema carpocapsae TaxID=34508 RepID=A0A4U5LYP1_STECR|nr:hypothetical protein L596_028505 [Steinernema carpocapsae]